MVIIIGAINEIEGSMDERRNLLSKLLKCAGRLPSWMKMLFTSRAEEPILQSFQNLPPVLIEQDDPRHVRHLRDSRILCVY